MSFLWWFYFQPTGRCSRKFYWLPGILPLLVLGILVGFVQALLGVKELPLGALVFLLPLGWVGIAVAAKRWHDANLSAWLALLNLVPILNFVVMILLGCLPGTVGSNRYGLDPKRPPKERAA